MRYCQFGLFLPQSGQHLNQGKLREARRFVQFLPLRKMGGWKMPKSSLPKFSEILTTLGFRETELIQDDGLWNMWRATYRTPVGDVKAFYLYLKKDCYPKEATATNKKLWSDKSEGKGYRLVLPPSSRVLPPSSRLADNLSQAQNIFGALEAKTTKQLLLDNIVRDLAWNPVDDEKYFVDPDLKLNSGAIAEGATQYMIEWLKGERTQNPAESIAVLTAPGGVGKTTLARHLCDRLHKVDPNIYPVLIESQQWQTLLGTSGQLTMDTVWNAALSNCFKDGSPLRGNKIARGVLVREGLFVVMFDGFDELCVYPEGAMSPKAIIDELVDLVTPEEGEVIQARILLTARETFWESIQDDIGLSKSNVFRLQEFSNKKRNIYFGRRLKVHAERDTASRLASEISGGIYGGLNRGDQNTDRLSGVPFMLDLIARYVEGNPDPNLNPYETDPFARFLKNVCRREELRQNLGINPDKQFELFEELFRAYPESVSFADLSEYLGIVCEVSDLEVAKRFTGHVFLTALPGDKDDGRPHYGPHYEVIRVYFLARFLALSLLKTTGGANPNRAAIVELLAKNSTGKTQVVDLLAEQLQQQDEKGLLEAMHHALRMICDEDKEEMRKKSGMALFHLAQKLVNGQQDKIERTKQLVKLLTSGGAAGFRTITLTGQLHAYDLSNITFTQCQFVDVSFKNCRFSTDTVFENCNFEGTLGFASCDAVSQIQVNDATCSNEAEYELGRLQDTGPTKKVRESLAEDVLRRALRRFRGPYGFSTIQYSDRNTGFKPSNPYNKKVWDVLEGHRIIEKHHISGVVEGGLNVQDDDELKRDLRSFLDNNVIDGRLSQVIASLIE